MAQPTLTSMEFEDGLSFAAWTELGLEVSRYSSASSWWLGDWLLYGQSWYRHRYREGIACTGLDYQTLRNYAVVARRFMPERRRSALSFHHHAEVCSLADEDQEFWLDLATDNAWSKTELRRRLRASCRPAGSGDASHVFRLVLEADRELRWREAAGRTGCALEAWIIDALDEAARALLEDPSHEVSASLGEMRGSWNPATPPALRKHGTVAPPSRERSYG